MTVDEVRRRVAEIREKAWDDEVAHGMEDNLWRDVLRAIATEKVAGAEASATEDIDFSRWCA